MNWERAKEVLDETYRYFNGKNNFWMLNILNLLYDRFQEGERSEELYEEIMGECNDEYEWQEMK